MLGKSIPKAVTKILDDLSNTSQSLWPRAGQKVTMLYFALPHTVVYCAMSWSRNCLPDSKKKP